MPKGTVFVEIRAGAGFKTDDFFEKKLGERATVEPPPWEKSVMAEEQNLVIRRHKFVTTVIWSTLAGLSVAGTRPSAKTATFVATQCHPCVVKCAGKPVDSTKNAAFRHDAQVIKVLTCTCSRSTRNCHHRVHSFHMFERLRLYAVIPFSRHGSAT